MLDIWDEIRTIEQRMDDLLRSYLGPRGPRFLTTPFKGAQRPFIPTSDVFAHNGDLVVRAELPGIDPDSDVQVTLTDGELVIRGERKQTEKVEEDRYYRAEVSYGAFERHVPVPAETTDADVEATYDQGVLEVVVHHAKEVEPPAEATRIPVRTTKAKPVEPTT